MKRKSLKLKTRIVILATLVFLLVVATSSFLSARMVFNHSQAVFATPTAYATIGHQLH